MNHVLDSKANMHSHAAHLNQKIQSDRKKAKAVYEHHLLGQDNAQHTETAPEEPTSGYWEQAIFGFIDGITAPYNTNCNDALKTTNDSLFRIWQYKLVMVPTNTAKLQLAGNGFTTGTSNVYAYCDFTALYGEFAQFADYENYEQYISFASRIMGAWVSDIPTYRQCISEGKKGQLGYDVGLCYGGITTLVLDTLL